MVSLPSSSSIATAYDGLAMPVRKWVWDQGWQSLRDIQERAINTILGSDRDVIIAAPTAGGKTEAAFLPLVSSIIETPGDTGFDVVYVSPLRALINDQLGRITGLCEISEIPVYPWHGDISNNVKERARKTPKGILLITPESLEAMFVLRGNEISRYFHDTRAVVVDELHALLDNERGMQLRSILARMEQAVGRRIRRIGLSATLSDMDVVRECIRPDDPRSVDVLESNSDSTALQIQVKGYLDFPANDEEDDVSSSRYKVARHMFKYLRGKPNLVFAGTRQNVEWYADSLRTMCEKYHVPVDFLPHHANLSREHRMHLEERLKTVRTTTAVCTSTLELGIDIGDIDCVAHVGAPYSVASLRHRLGRSGRRPGQPAVLRMYIIEDDPAASVNPLDYLYLGLVRAIAMVELLLERWCEPPATSALHLSTLVHQILSVVAERGGASARDLYGALCLNGPFRNVDTETFADVLRDMGASEDAPLLEQAPDGNLLLGVRGEAMVEHFSFYAVFQTQEEYRVMADGRLVGTLPMNNMMTAGMAFIFSGRRWRILGIDDRAKIIQVTADSRGQTTPFGGSGGVVHDHVVAKMRHVLDGDDVPSYLDQKAAGMLADARSAYRSIKLDRRWLVATWSGTIKTFTMAVQLRAMGYDVSIKDGLLEVTKKSASMPSVRSAMAEIAESGVVPSDELLEGIGRVMNERFHRFLGQERVVADACSSRIDIDSMQGLAKLIMANAGVDVADDVDDETG